MEGCDTFNQYYTDIVNSEGDIVHCFDGKIYKEGKTFEVNDYKGYKSKGYYNWINDNFKDYAFPEEEYSENDYARICESQVYSLKQQQKFAGRLFNTNTDINSMLIYHGLGSGKTQTSIVIGEAFKFRTVDNTIINGRAESRVFIVVPAALQNQYYAEIIGKYEQGVIKSAPGEIWIMGKRQYYANKAVRVALSSNYNEIYELRKKKEHTDDPKKVAGYNRDIETVKTRNKDLEEDERIRINKIYEIMSHETFLNKLFKIEDTVYEEQSYLKTLDVYGNRIPHGVFKENALLIVDEIQNLISATGTNYRRLLYALRYYAHPKFRCIFLTGTPIYDKPFEIGLLMNLLRARTVFPSGRDDFNALFLEDKANISNKEYFKQMCSGYISYFKGGNPIAYPYKKTTVMHHQMGIYQYEQYKQALIKEVERDQKNKINDDEFFINKESDKVSTGIYNNSNQLCNIAYPASTVTVGNMNTLEKNKAEFVKQLSAEARKYTNLNEQTEAILRLVHNYSSKFAAIAKMLLDCPGTAFVFSNYVYYGVDAMGAIMNNLGLAEYPARGPRGNYFIWKGEANSKRPEMVKAAKKAFNDPRNADGSLLKIMFGTQTVMEGVDFKNVNQIHIIDPWWNDSRLQQIIARGIRLCSHKDLPPELRFVNVFIHLSTLGSYENVFTLEIEDETGYKKQIKSLMQIENRSNPDPSQWIVSEAYVKLDKENNTEIYSSNKKFMASQIVEGSIKRGPDQSITKNIGGWKGLDRISIQEYMYKRSLFKLDVNRQFEMAIKEVAVDCALNKNGNVVRLNEMYTPNEQYNGTWDLVYENYSTGETFIRVGCRSATPGLPENVFTLNDILNNTAMRSGVYSFKNTVTKQTKTIKNLIVPEKIDCTSTDYSFSFPKEIVNLTINKELIPYLFKMGERKLYDYIFSVINNPNNPNLFDKKLPGKLSRLLRKRTKEREKYINGLREYGFSGNEELWEQYTTEQLRIEYNAVN